MIVALGGLFKGRSGPARPSSPTTNGDHLEDLTLPGTDITVPNVVLGLMRIADMSDDEIRALIGAARDAGSTSSTTPTSTATTCTGASGASPRPCG